MIAKLRRLWVANRDILTLLREFLQKRLKKNP